MQHTRNSLVLIMAGCIELAKEGQRSSSYQAGRSDEALSPELTAQLTGILFANALKDNDIKDIVLNKKK